MIAKGISHDDFSENGVGRQSNRSFRMRTMTVSGSSLTHSPRRVVPYFYQYVGNVFSRTTSFVLKMIFFSYMVSVRESVRRHGVGHVDIQAGSRIYLCVCLNWSIAYALR